MARRSATAGYSGAPSNVYRGSGFDEREPPRLPAGLPKPVRAICKQVLAENVHLWDASQVPAIIRLAELRVRYREMSAVLDAEGYTLVKQNGDITKHPLVSGITSVSTAILAIERSLAINFLGRGGAVKEAEKTRPGRLIDVRPSAGTDDQPARQLRLA